MMRNKLYMVIFAAMLVACSEEVEVSSTSGNGRGIGFATDISQDWTGEQESTRAMMRQQQVHALPLTASDGTELWLKATTRSGIEMRNNEGEAEDELTSRGTPVTSVSGMGNFSSFCYKASDYSALYENVAVDNAGILQEKKSWPEDVPLQFFAVHPQDATAANFGGSGSTGLSYNFTVSTTVTAQKDLMYATSGAVAYNEDQVAPLHFKHALTAVTFAVGDFAFEGTVKKIVVKNVCTTGTYTLPTANTATDGVKGTWSNLGNRADITISGLNVSTTNTNTAITSGETTLLIIPQDLTDVSVEFTLEVGGTELVVSGSLYDADYPAWVEGTTRTYIVGSTKDISGYTLIVSGSPTFDHKGNVASGSTSSFTVRSFKSISTRTDAVAWEVVKYETSDDGGTTWTDCGTTRPTWLTSLGLGTDETDEGEGSADATSYTTVVGTDIKDYKAERGNALKEADAKGSATDPYDLSLHDIKGNTTSRNTANCYVISAPGYYSIPLVYGNAITNGAEISTCYTSTAAGKNYVLNPFHDYQGNGIISAWIKNNTANGVPTSAALVWSDISEDIITFPTPAISGDYLTFNVTKENIEQGNAVVAVKDKDGTIMWSWHLWFAPDDVLETTTVTNYQGYEYKFTKEKLGFKYDEWLETTYTQPRKIRVTIQQKEAPTGEAAKTGTFIITQNNYSNMTFATTLYQFGRKDALPGTDTFFPSGGFDPSGTGKVTYATAIQNPGTFYRSPGLYNWCSATYNNAWSAGNTVTTANDNAVVKTVYDPCPAGFHMPASNAFTGFSTTGNNTSTSSQFNVSGSWNKGWTFYSYGRNGATDEERTSSSTLFFPASGCRLYSSGSLYSVWLCGTYWSAFPYDYYYGRYLSFISSVVGPLYKYNRADGQAVRPVGE